MRPWVQDLAFSIPLSTQGETFFLPHYSQNNSTELIRHLSLYNIPVVAWEKEKLIFFLIWLRWPHIFQLLYLLANPGLTLKVIVKSPLVNVSLCLLFIFKWPRQWLRKECNSHQTFSHIKQLKLFRGKKEREGI